MQTLNFQAMHCEITAVIDRDEYRAAEQIAQVPIWFAKWENCLSRFLPDSELCRLNRSQGVPFAAGEVLWETVQTALYAAQWTEGLVTPTVLGALETIGYDRSFETIGARGKTGQITLPIPVGNWREIVCDLNLKTICLPANSRLDLGGIAKGWAAGEAARRLSVYGPALVDAGGDIAVSGPRLDGSPWPIGVADSSGFIVETLMLTGGAVATSGRDYRFWKQDSTDQHHILDPRTGQPAMTDVVTATVIAPSTWEAEAAAKVVLILGSRDRLRWLEERPGLAGLVICEDGRFLRSERLGSHLWRNA